jgi:glycosyltransferase involved in cell wall biosynthesis
VPCVSTPLENLSRWFREEPAIRFSGWDGEGFGAAVLGLLAMPAGHRRALGLAAADRVARELDWPVIAGNAADFVESRVR